MSDNSRQGINIPVAVVVFNRLDCMKEILDSIRKVMPPRLYIISDGPRKGVEGEDVKVEAVRRYAEENVDWDCELIKVYSDRNMGCTVRSVTGYDEVFEHEEMAILLEDDTIPVSGFYSYCEQMLEYYKDSEKIMMVTGENRIPDFDEGYDYYYSAFPMKQAFGTWRRAWIKWHQASNGEFDLRTAERWLKRNTENKGVRYYYGSKLIRCKMKLYDVWDGIWDCAMLANEGVGIVSRYHMEKNIGIGREDATYMKEDAELAHLPVGDYEDAISMRIDEIKPDMKYDREQSSHMLTDSYGYYLRANMAYFVYRLFPGLYKKISRYFTRY